MLERYDYEYYRIQKENGATVYRASVYLGVDKLTGKKARTTVTANTKRALKLKLERLSMLLQLMDICKGNSQPLLLYKELVALWWEEL